MRMITLRYAGECHKCGEPMAEGSQGVYERRVGVFHPNCAPTDPEQIRSVRQEGADHKADRLEEWAQKRRVRAQAVFASHEPYTSDHAFNTQPGYIPLRARIIRQEDRAFESLQVAEGFERRAESLRHIRVAGDAERNREAQREQARAWVKVGTRFECPIYGPGTVTRINKKTVTAKFDRGFTQKSDLSWVHRFNLEPTQPVAQD